MKLSVQPQNLPVLKTQLIKYTLYFLKTILFTIYKNKDHENVHSILPLRWYSTEN